MNRGVRNWANFDELTPLIGEVTTEVSLTVPDMTLSMRDLLTRYTRGENVATFVPVYTDDPIIPDNLERLDKLERLDFLKAVKADTDEIRAKLAERAKERAGAETAKLKRERDAALLELKPVPEPVKSKKGFEKQSDHFEKQSE